MLKLYTATKMFFADLKDDSEGATIIEYSLLIGLLTVAIVATVVLVGTWLGTQWTTLCGVLPGC